MKVKVRQGILTGVILCNLSTLGVALAQDPYQKGIDAFARGDYQTAANMWLIEAYEGSHDAQFNLGVMYIEGKGVAQNRDDAVFWFSKAAEGGHIQAQYNLGHLYFEQKDNPQALAKGLDWWHKSASGGFSIAQFNYARALYYGAGTERNLEQAKFWMEQAAGSGEQVAVRFLQQHAAEFKGVPSLNQDSSNEVVTRQDITNQDITNQEINNQETTNQETDNLNSNNQDSGSAAAGSNPVTQTQVAAVSKPESNKADPVASASDTVALHYVQVGQESSLIHSRSSGSSAVLMEATPQLVLRAISREGNWLQVQIPGGAPAWITQSDTRLQGSFVELLATKQLLTDSKSNAINNTINDGQQDDSDNILGELPATTKLLFLGQAGGWIRVLSPETVPGWIRDNAVSKVTQAEHQLMRQWQSLQISRKLELLARSNDLNIQTEDEPQLDSDSSNQSLSFHSDTPSQTKDLTVDEFVDLIDKQSVELKVPTSAPTESGPSGTESQ